MAACGQLKSESRRLSVAERVAERVAVERVIAEKEAALA